MNTGDEPIIYKFDGGRGAVLCRGCRVILNKKPISWADAVEIYTGKDICPTCKSKMEEK